MLCNTLKGIPKWLLIAFSNVIYLDCIIYAYLTIWNIIVVYVVVVTLREKISVNVNNTPINFARAWKTSIYLSVCILYVKVKTIIPNNNNNKYNINWHYQMCCKLTQMKIEWKRCKPEEKFVCMSNVVFFTSIKLNMPDLPSFMPF